MKMNYSIYLKYTFNQKIKITSLSLDTVAFVLPETKIYGLPNILIHVGKEKTILSSTPVELKIKSKLDDGFKIENEILDILYNSDKKLFCAHMLFDKIEKGLLI